jgi:hypothetical protein
MYNASFVKYLLQTAKSSNPCMDPLSSLVPDGKRYTDLICMTVFVRERERDDLPEVRHDVLCYIAYISNHHPLTEFLWPNPDFPEYILIIFVTSHCIIILKLQLNVHKILFLFFVPVYGGHLQTDRQTDRKMIYFSYR